jgi:hypothetical protein
MTTRCRRLALATALVTIVTGRLSFTTDVSAETQSWSVVGTIPGPADLVQIRGTRAYVADAAAMRIIDVSDAAAPKLIGRFTFPEKIWAFTVVGPLAYVAADWFGFAILDIATPEAPVLRGSFKTLGQAWGLAVSDRTAVVANQMSGIDVLDISNLDSPRPVGNYFTEGYARDVAISGSLAYVVDQPTGFSVLDVSQGGPPREVSTQQSAQSPLIVALAPEGSTAATSPRLACVVGGRGPVGSRLQVYDISDPAAPVRVAAYKTPGRALRVAVHGSRAYVADGPEGLQIVDLSNPAAPMIAESFKTPGPARDVALSESLMLVVSGDASKGDDPKAGGAGVLILRRTP